MIRLIIKDELGIDVSERTGWIPAECMTRHDWQQSVESILARIRALSDSPAFGLSAADISVHYHKPIEDFAALLNNRLGL